MTGNKKSSEWLSVEECTKRYGNIIALDSVSFTAAEGVTLLHGRNGSGKSTIISIMEGLTSINSGNVSINGINPFREPQKVMGNVAFLPERPQIFGSRGVGDFLYWYVEMNEGDYSELERLLEFFELRPLVKSNFNNLSSGEKQLIVLSAILSSKKRAYVLDEPNANIDSARRMQIALEIERKSKQGSSFLITTHMLDDLLPIANSMVQISMGKLKKILNKEDIKNNSEITVRIWVAGKQSFENLKHLDVTISKDIIDIRGSTIPEILNALTQVQRENIISINSVPEMI